MSMSDEELKFKLLQHVEVYWRTKDTRGSLLVAEALYKWIKEGKIVEEEEKEAKE